MQPEDRLRALGIVLPGLAAPVGNYVDLVIVNGLAFCSGKGPRDQEGRPIGGKVGTVFTRDEAYAHARSVGLLLLAGLRAELGSLDRVTRIVKVLGLVNAVPSFTEHPKVINGCSDLFIEIFGERGRHARSAIGVASLPSDIPVEIEMVAQVG